MRQADVKVGYPYWTKVSGVRTCVIVLEAVETTSISGIRRLRFRVRRVNSEAPLPGLRVPSALTPMG